MSNDNIPVFPVASWQVGPIQSLGMVTFRPNFLTHPFQKLEEANEGRFYALTPVQVQMLVLDLQKALRAVETSDEKAPPGPKQ